MQENVSRLVAEEECHDQGMWETYTVEAEFNVGDGQEQK